MSCNTLRLWNSWRKGQSLSLIITPLCPNEFFSYSWSFIPIEPKIKNDRTDSLVIDGLPISMQKFRWRWKWLWTERRLRLKTSGFDRITNAAWPPDAGQWCRVTRYLVYDILYILPDSSRPDGSLSGQLASTMKNITE